MIRPPNDLPVVYLCRDAIEFRKGINGLAVLVEDTLQFDVNNCSRSVLAESLSNRPRYAPDAASSVQ